MIPAIKFSDNPEKTTNPGIKNVYRIYDEDGMAKADILALEDEEIVANKEAKFYHPSTDYRHFTFKPAKVEMLLKKKLENGKRISPRLSDKEQLAKARETLTKQLETIDTSYQRILNPHIYKVSLSEKLKDLKLDFIEDRIK